MAKEAKNTKINEIKPEDSRIYDYILIGLFAIFIILITTFKISGDDDIFWHLETGRYIVENKTVPSADVFGFVTRGQEWIPFEWGWDVLNYVAFSIGGYPAVSVMRTVFLTLMFYFFYKTIRRLDLSIVISALIFIILIFGMFDRLIPKPQIISYLFFTVLLYILISFQTFNRGKIKLLYYLPVLFLLWCNMHMGVLAGLGIFAIYIISEITIYFKPKNSNLAPLSKNDIIKVLYIYIISLIVLIINPHGINTYFYVYSHLNMKMLEDVFEWYSPFNKVFSETIYQCIYFFFLISALAVLYYAYKSKNLFFGLVTAVLAVFSISSSRYTIDFMLIISLLLAISLGSLLKNSKNVKSKMLLLNLKIPRLALSAILLFFIITIPSDKLYGYLGYTRLFGFGVDTYDYPVKLFNFIKGNNIHNTGSRPFNSFSCGGYLIWELKDKKNFIDSRNLSDDIYYNYKTINNKLAGFEPKFESYGFDYVLWTFAYLPLNPIELKTSIISYLIKNNDKWKLVYWDDNSYVFVRNEEKFKDIIAQNEYKYVNPYFYTYDKEPLKKATYDDVQRIVQEIQRNYKLNPEGVFINAMAKTFKIPVSR